MNESYFEILQPFFDPNVDGNLQLHYFPLWFVCFEYKN